MAIQTTETDGTISLTGDDIGAVVGRDGAGLVAWYTERCGPCRQVLTDDPVTQKRGAQTGRSLRDLTAEYGE